MKELLKLLTITATISVVIYAIIYFYNIYEKERLEQAGITVIRTIDYNNWIVEIDGKKYFYVRTRFGSGVTCEYKE